MDTFAYVTKISNATPLGLVIINYELTLDCVNMAITAFNTSDGAAFEANITKSRDFLMLLMKSLDFNIDVSNVLYKEYVYINSLLIKAYFSHDIKPLNTVYERMTELLNAWKELIPLEDAAPVMENAQTLYAGLTYKDGHAVIYTPEDETRGFKA